MQVNPAGYIRYDITTETLDLSELFMRVKDIQMNTERFKQKKSLLSEYSNWSDVPGEKLDILTKVSVAIDDFIHDYRLDCLALRCWIEIEKELGVSPCVLLSELNDRGFVAACELDVCNAIPMYALSLASQRPAACLDWNNNYGNEENKCILFHCGPVPQSLMVAKGKIVDHPMFAKSFGTGCG
jgi:L-fucose isomerase-like protein